MRRSAGKASPHMPAQYGTTKTLNLVMTWQLQLLKSCTAHKCFCSDLPDKKTRDN